VYDNDGNGGGGSAYGVTYGPDSKGGCIQDTDGSDGIGRFPQLHGTSKDSGHYQSDFTNKVWEAYWQPDAASDGKGKGKQSDDTPAAASISLGSAALQIVAGLLVVTRI